MYKLDRNNPISNISRNVKRFFPNTLDSSKTFVFTFAASSIIIATTFHPALQPSLESVRGGMGFVMTSATLVTLGNTVHNFKHDWKRWLELGKQMALDKEKHKLQEKEQMSQFLTVDQIRMKEFTQGDKVIPIGLFQDSSDNPSGGRQEEVGFSKVFKLPGR